MSVLNEIDSFSFIELAGNPEKVKQQIAMYTRAGVDGITLIDDGARGVPFVLRSKVDVDDMSAGRSTYAAYCNLIGDDPVEVVYQDVVLSNYFAVLNVTQQVLKAISASVGGFSSGGGAWLECDWTLVAINN